MVGQAQMRRLVRGEQVELGAVRVRRVNDGRQVAETAGARQQLDRAAAVLGEALLDLARLLARMHVQRQPLSFRVRADLLEPVARTGAHGVGGNADRDAVGAQRLDLGEVGATVGWRMRSSPPRA